jgi:hypothetical protein
VAERFWAEKKRAERLEDAGFVLVRWGWDDVIHHGDRLIARIRRAFVHSTRAAS